MATVLLPQTDSFSRERIRALLIAEVALILKLDESEVDPAKGFDEYGLDSVAGVVLLNAIEESLGIELEPEVVMRGRCINEIVETLASIGIEHETSTAA